MLWEILQNKSLGVLGTSSDQFGNQHSSPSWVPDFDRLDPHFVLNAKTGDLVCTLYGADVPYVLRWTVNGQYILAVEECYMHEIMHGEALERPDVKDQEMEFAII